MVNDNPKKNIEGNPNNNSFVELTFLLSSGKIKLKQRNAAGVIPDVAKLILPQNNIEEDPIKKYSTNTLHAHPAQAQARIEKIKFTRLWTPDFL